MIACAGAHLWPWLALIAAAVVVGPWVAWRLGRTEVRGQYTRHPAGGVHPSNVTVIRPATAPEARLALAAANAVSESPGPVYDQATEGQR